MSTQTLQNEPKLDSIQHLSSLKDRLQKYKLKNQAITEKEIELEAIRIEKEKLEKEREAIRLETEKQALILELQRVSNVKPAKPQPSLAQQQQFAQQQFQQQQQQLFHQQQQQLQQQLQQQQPFSFGYPAMVTEKEAIDWLRNGF